MCFSGRVHLSHSSFCTDVDGWLMHVLCLSGTFNLILKVLGREVFRGFCAFIFCYKWLVIDFSCHEFEFHRATLTCKTLCSPQSVCKCSPRCSWSLSIFFSSHKVISRKPFHEIQWFKLKSFKTMGTGRCDSDISRHIFARCGAVSDADSTWTTRKTRRRNKFRKFLFTKRDYHF